MNQSSTAIKRESLEGENKFAVAKFDQDIVVGKDILELLSSSMYINPLTVFREYIQNSADAIDEARANKLFPKNEVGEVRIYLDAQQRRVRIRDNGIGVPNSKFFERLSAFGASQKRGTHARGFRGVGRLSGLGYCQELIFRSRSQGDTKVMELRWDCRKFKSLLSSSDYHGDLYDVVREIVTYQTISPEIYPDHFFEVELVKPSRLKNDQLLNEELIENYLSQVAPVPFSPDFKYGSIIKDKLKPHVSLGELSIYIADSEVPIYRPYKNYFDISETKRDEFNREPSFHVISGLGGQPAAIAWILHHGYQGAIQNGIGIKGLRARSGNIQIGDYDIFTDVFPESRFNSWTVGEVHVIEPKILPNGRRDNFEQSSHYLNLINHLTPIGHKIARLCRDSSAMRNRIKAFELAEMKILEHLEVLKQGSIPKALASNIQKDIGTALSGMKKDSNSDLFTEGVRAKLCTRIAYIEKSVSKTVSSSNAEKPLDRLPVNKKRIYKEVFGLIYECSANKVVAKSLVDRILDRISQT